MLTENSLYIIVFIVVITVNYCKSIVLLYSPLKHDSNWYDINYSVMKEVLIAKLKSNSKFRDALLLSEDKILVEALPDIRVCI